MILSGSTLYGMTSSGGTNLGDDEGTVFSIQTDGTGYKVLHDFTVPGQGQPQGSLIISGSTLYGMTDGGSLGSGSVFLINTDGSGFLAFHSFTGTTTDGGNPRGSLIRQGVYLYGMTSTGGANGVGTVFQLYLFGSQFHILHSFSTGEAFTPIGDLVASGGTLYGMTSAGVTNYRNIGILGGSGAVFQIQTNGDGYQVMHTFEFPFTTTDGSVPLGSPMLLGSELFGMTSLGGSEGLPLATQDGGTLFALTLPAGSGGGTGGGSGPPTISTTSPLPNGKVGTAYHEQLAATGGTAPYTWAVSAGHLPPGLTLSAAGVLGGKPTKGEVAAFTIKVTGHDKETSLQSFSITVETPPTLVITSPKAAQKILTPTFNVTGTAADAVGGVAGVYYQLNGGAWTLAQSANNYANWTIPNLPLPADADVLSAYAVDTFGNRSKTNTVKFTYFVTGELTVKTNGNGSFTPPDNGKNFQIGATLTITAKPAKGFAFLNWTNGNGTVLTNRPVLKFVMSSNLVLTANFVPSGNLETAPSFEVPASPFQETAGSYAGLFAPSGDSRENSNSGAVRLTLSDTGLFSGKLTIGADSLPFVGSFDASGKASVSISGNVECADCPPARVLPGQQAVALRKKANMTATLQLDFAHQTVSGEVTDGGFVAQLAANRGAFSSSNPAQGFQGTYAVAIAGDGATLAVAMPTTWNVRGGCNVGNVYLHGGVPKRDSRASQMSLLSRDGYFPLYFATARWECNRPRFIVGLGSNLEWKIALGANRSHVVQRCWQSVGAHHKLNKSVGSNEVGYCGRLRSADGKCAMPGEP